MKLQCCICGITSGANSHIKCSPALMTLSSILFVVLMEKWHGFIVSSNTKIYMPWFDLCCSISNIQNSMPQDLTLIGHHLPGEGNGNALQYSCLENPIDRGAWRAIVHRVAKSQTQLSDYILKLFFFFKIFFLLFLMRTIFKVFVEFVTILLLFYVLVFWPGDPWDLIFLTRDPTRTSRIGRSLNHWTIIYIL